MRVLVVGSGGREHALAWKIARSPLVSEVLAAPGSAGMASDARCFPEVGARDGEALVALAKGEAVDLVVIGPEDPLADGLADRLRAAGFAVFGPSKAAAQLEASKSFAKDFMQRHAIPTAAHRSFDALEPAIEYARELAGPCVVKADGLAAGKGVYLCSDPADAERALREIMEDQRFGEAGSRVVVEEFLEGEEASYYAITDSERIVTLAAAQDHKRALDGDLGENTGGMGAYSPTPVFSEAVEKRVLEEIVRPVFRGMRDEGTPFCGVLYVGLMIDAAGAPKVVEFNVRFGDPETQALLVRMDGDLVPILDGAARGQLDEANRVGWGDASVCVVLASGGYPRSYQTGKEIHGLAELAEPADLADLAASDDVVVFHSGTRSRPGGGFETAGGRVLGVTARGETVAEARRRAYEVVERITFSGVQFRRDIADRALGR